jgi:hypothetical protein
VRGLNSVLANTATPALAAQNFAAQNLAYLNPVTLNLAVLPCVFSSSGVG